MDVHDMDIDLDFDVFPTFQEWFILMGGDPANMDPEQEAGLRFAYDQDRQRFIENQQIAEDAVLPHGDEPPELASDDEDENDHGIEGEVDLNGILEIDFPGFRPLRLQFPDVFHMGRREPHYDEYDALFLDNRRWSFHDTREGRRLDLNRPFFDASHVPFDPESLDPEMHDHYTITIGALIVDPPTVTFYDNSSGYPPLLNLTDFFQENRVYPEFRDRHNAEYRLITPHSLQDILVRQFIDKNNALSEVEPALASCFAPRASFYNEEPSQKVEPGSHALVHTIFTEVYATVHHFRKHIAHLEDGELYELKVDHIHDVYFLLRRLGCIPFLKGYYGFDHIDVHNLMNPHRGIEQLVNFPFDANLAISWIAQSNYGRLHLLRLFYSLLVYSFDYFILPILSGRFPRRDFDLTGFTASDRLPCPTFHIPLRSVFVYFAYGPKAFYPVYAGPRPAVVRTFEDIVSSDRYFEPVVPSPLYRKTQQAEYFSKINRRTNQTFFIPVSQHVPQPDKMPSEYAKGADENEDPILTAYWNSDDKLSFCVNLLMNDSRFHTLLSHVPHNAEVSPSGEAIWHIVDNGDAYEKLINYIMTNVPFEFPRPHDLSGCQLTL